MELPRGQTSVGGFVMMGATIAMWGPTQLPGGAVAQCIRDFAVSLMLGRVKGRG